jgi:cyanophycinase-like exopeptidase
MSRKRLHEGEVLVGIDENTAIVGTAIGAWTVMGEAKAHIFSKDNSTKYSAGETFSLGK